MDESKRYRIGKVVATVGASLIYFAVLVSEIPLIPESQQLFYFGAKGFLAASLLCLGWWIWLDHRSEPANLLTALNFMCYTLLGQWYRPLYYLAYAQLLIAFSFFFVVSKRMFRSVLVVWTAAFLLVMHHRWDENIEALSHPLYSDLVFAVGAIALIAWIIHTYFTAERQFRSFAQARFSRMGFQSARLIHSLKGLTAAPRLYAQLLKDRLKDSEDPEVSRALQALSGDLENLEQFVLELNQLSSLRTDRELEGFSAEEAMEAVRKLLGNRLANVNVNVGLNTRLRADRSMLTTILLNLILNSLDTFRNRKVAEPKIQLRFSGRSLIYSDNGGGFETEVLALLRSEQPVSTKETGSGLGLWIAMDVMNNMGGRVKFLNEQNGARVDLVFPRRAVLA